MRGATLDKESWKGRIVKIIAADSVNHHAARVHDVVACQAFQICERGGFVPGHEREDWRQAEAEVLRPLGCGLLTLDDKVIVHTDSAVFAEGVIEIYVEPNRLMICGKPCAAKEEKTAESNTGRENLIFRVLELPVAIDGSQVRAGFNGRILQIHLPRVPTSAESRHVSHAA